MAGFSSLYLNSKPVPTSFALETRFPPVTNIDISPKYNFIKSLGISLKQYTRCSIVADSLSKQYSVPSPCLRSTYCEANRIAKLEAGSKQTGVQKDCLHHHHLLFFSCCLYDKDGSGCGLCPDCTVDFGVAVQVDINVGVIADREAC